MTWVRLDDHFDENKKLAAVGPLGIALWTVGLAYCNRNLTDGVIPWSVARRLLAWDFLGAAEEDGMRRRYSIAMTSGMVGDNVDSDFVIELLVAAGLWEELDNGAGYYVHDYDEYQPSKEEVLAEREKTRERQQRFRSGKRNGVTNAGGNGVTNAGGNVVSNGHVTLPPVPVPVPDPVPVPVPDLSVSVPPPPHRTGLTPEQELLRIKLHGLARDQLLGGMSAPDLYWCEDLIRRGLTETDAEYAVQQSLGKGLKYARTVAERRVVEREAGVDHDQLARDRAESAARESHSGSSRARGVARDGAGGGSADEWGDLPPNAIRAADHGGDAAEGAGARAPISLAERARTGGGAG